MQIKSFILRNGIFWLLALLVAAGLKYHYSHARSDDLAWILGPTAGLVEHLSGITFEKEAHAGYVSRTQRIIIAPACAGVNFFIIAFCMAVFSGIAAIEPKRLKLLWLCASLLSAYVLTLLVNALRIIFAIYFYDLDIYTEWITPERTHRLEGTLIYFFFLCLFYRIIKKGIVCYRGWAAAKQNIAIGGLLNQYRRLRWAFAALIPLFWYALITLVIPLLNGAWRENGARFVEHSGMVIGGCLIVLALIFLIQRGWQRIDIRIKRSKGHSENIG